MTEYVKLKDGRIMKNIKDADCDGMIADMFVVEFTTKEDIEKYITTQEELEEELKKEYKNGRKRTSKNN